MRTWRTLDDDRIAVRDDGGPERIPLLEVPAGALANVTRWRPITAPASSRHGTPLPWTEGVMWAESQGRNGLVSPAGAVGLMQVMPVMHGASAEELGDPVVNVDIGTRLLGDSKRAGLDLVQAASVYNAGPGKGGLPKVSSHSPWGVVEDPGYIDRVVAAANRLRSVESSGGSGGGWFVAGALIWWLWES